MNQKLKKDTWIVGNEEDGANIWGLSIFPQVFSYYFPKFTKLPPMYNITDYKGEHFRLLVPSKHWESVGKKILNKVLKDPSYFTKVSKEVEKYSKQLVIFSQECLQTDPQTLNNKQLVELFEKHTKLNQVCISWGMVSTVTEVSHGLFTAWVESFIQQRANQLKLKTSPAILFQNLSAITTQTAQRKEHVGLLNILVKIQTQKNVSVKTLKKLLQNPNYAKKVSEHVQIHNWSYYNYNGPAFTKDRVTEELADMLRMKVSARFELTKVKQDLRRIPLLRKQTEIKLRMTPYEKSVFRAYRETMVMKFVRRDALTFSFFALEKHLHELAKRLGISVKLARCILTGEHKKVFSYGKKIKQLLEDRTGYFALDCSGKSPLLLTGRKAENFVNKTYKEQTAKNVTELKGQVACVGFARGKVKIVNLPADMSKMQKGDILVSIATMPEIVSAMKKAGAIVTEQGGITSHAAIVSRELGIPCVIGTKIATKIFKDGDIIEVDANKGTVKII